MTKHILDRPNSTPRTFSKHWMKAASKERPHSATLALQRRRRMRNEAQRTAFFMRFARQAEMET